MSGFRIVAIKTGNLGITLANFLKTPNISVEYNYYKNLEQNKVYNFYSHFTFPNNDFSEIHYDQKTDFDLYQLKLSDGKIIPVNINAIVGTNGSGKSTLIELLYLMNYNIGVTFNLLKDVNDNEYQIYNTLELQLLYEVNNNEFYILKFEDGTIKQKKILFSNNRFKEDLKSTWTLVSKTNELKDFFYSVVINYSQYSLNALEVGEWINPLFHKNDGYQTPIVLNPKRENGDIEVNREIELLSRRLQSNVLEPINNGDINNSLRNIANNKVAKVFEVTFNSSYFNEQLGKNRIIKPQLLNTIRNEIEILFSIKYLKPNDIYSNFVRYIYDYIYLKLEKIVYKYSIYKKHRVVESLKDISSIENGESITQIHQLLIDIFKSNSHIVFKIKGAILHLKYFDKIYKNSKINFDHPFQIKIDEFSKLINEHIIPNETSFLVNTYMMALPSFFKVEIIPDKGLTMGGFSSGEKQQIFSLSSLAYHLINLNSVEEQKLKTGLFTSYQYINIVLDEIELYYHPEWQRKYVYTLLKYLEKISPNNLKNIKSLNIIFVTHSPFILSDIPGSNILRLVEGKPKQFEEFQQTFGANIHDMLANDFFMNDGFMGEWAKEIITKILDWIESPKKSNKEYYSQLIEIIGEPIIKNRLRDLYNEKHQKPTYEQLLNENIYLKELNQNASNKN